MSLKRAGVDKLAKASHPVWRVLDLGAGQGSYAHWFLGRQRSTIVAVDWSPHALRSLCRSPQGSILRVCADARALPFRDDVFNALYSIDTLGHIPEVHLALDEISRVVKSGATMFLHSECADYRCRWPDSVLIQRLGTDMIAERDGHIGLRWSAELRLEYEARFTVGRFFSPAGVLGWIIGYPEKYALALGKARMPCAYVLALCGAALKRAPLIGVFVRLINALSNHIEVWMKIEGGGSCFAELTIPVSSEAQDLGES